MNSFYKLSNQIRNYSWGDSNYIPDFLGIENPENKPFAEMWMGAHPLASSRLDEADSVQLSDFISTNEINTLGPDISRDYGRLPFLFKLLAAGESLSIQAHPSKEMAEEGFKREDDAGIPRDAAERNYRDDNHKPEIIMAMTEFTAMIGFRSLQEILKSFSEFSRIEGLTALLQKIKKIPVQSSSDALRVFFEGILTLDEETTQNLLDSALDIAREDRVCWDKTQRQWISELVSSFPGDIGALAPLFLHVVELQPGEALYQPARALHAYLEGFGLELMANSDNVLRGGLTKKHIDVPELMKVLKFETSRPEILKPEIPDSGGIKHFITPPREFSLGLADFGTDQSINLPAGSGPEIVLVLEGKLLLQDGVSQLLLSRGESAFIPWNAGNIRITGNGRGAFAGVNR